MNRAILAALAFGLVGLTGCTPAEKAEVHEDVQGIRQEAQKVAESAQSAAEEAALEGKVKSALLTRKGLDARRIDVDAEGSRIILKGDVLSNEDAALAEQVARDTRGVTEVESRLMLRVPANPAAGTSNSDGTTNPPPVTSGATPGIAPPAPDDYRKTN